MRGVFDLDGPVMGALNKLFDCIFASILWLVFSLPIVTIGASSTALYTVTYKYLRRGEGSLLQTFWGAFRENLKRSTLVWLAALAVLALLTVDALVFRTLKLNDSPLGNVYWVTLALLCIAVTWTAFLSAYAARFNGSVKDVLRFGFVLMASHPVRAVEVFLPMLGGAALVLLQPFMLGIVPAAVCWLNSMVLEQIFFLHMRPEDAGRTRNNDAGSPL